jgi:hypothetical protein
MFGDNSNGYAKNSVNTEVVENGIEMQSFSKLGGTATDEHEMETMGKVQQLNVRPLCLSSCSKPI